MKQFIIHLIYWLIILSLVTFIYKTGAFLKAIFPETGGGVRLSSDVEIFNPETGEQLGFLRKGAILSGPNFEDLINCNVDGLTSDGFTRMKILVGLDVDLLKDSSQVDEISIRSGAGIINIRSKDIDKP